MAPGSIPNTINNTTATRAVVLFAGALGIEPRLLVLETKVLPLNDTPYPTDDSEETENPQLALRFFMSRVLAAPSAVLGERKLLLVSLLVLARIIAHPGAGAAFHLYEVFGKFGFSHASLSFITIPETRGLINCP